MNISLPENQTILKIILYCLLVGNAMKNFLKLLSIVRTSRFLKREKNPFTSYVVVLQPEIQREMVE